MKRMFSLFFVFISTISFGAEVIEVTSYKFTSPLVHLNAELERELVRKSKELCPNSELVRVTNPVVKFSHGPGVSGGDLIGILRLDDEESIDFPSHPFASLKAKVDCL